MNAPRALILCLLTGCGGAPAETTTTPTGAEPAITESQGDNTEGMALVDGFLADPLNTDPKPVLTWAMETSAVMVSVDVSLVSAGDPALAKYEKSESLLMLGFIAGNAREQLRLGVKQDQPLAGVQGMLTVYKALKVQNPDLSSLHCEELLKHENAGTLTDYVNELTAATGTNTQ